MKGLDGRARWKGSMEGVDGRIPREGSMGGFQGRGRWDSDLEAFTLLLCINKSQAVNNCLISAHSMSPESSSHKEHNAAQFGSFFCDVQRQDRSRGLGCRGQ